MTSAVAAGAGAPAAGAAGQADFSATQALLESLRARYPNTEFDAVSPAPMPGLYEVVMGRNVAYTNREGRLWLFGAIYDMHMQQDLTAKRVQELNRIDWQTLPHEAAFQLKKGDGRRHVAVFSDPDCPYCRRLEASIAALDNVTVHYFMFPIATLHPHAGSKVEKVWCSKDRLAAWRETIAGRPVLAESCATPLAAVLRFADAHEITGTPTLIAPDGRSISRYLDAAQLEAWLTQGR